MTSAHAVLALLAEPALQDELDRVAAAVGFRVVQLPIAGVPGRRNWSAATAVVLDDTAARRCAGAALPRRSAVFLLCSAQPTPATFNAAIAVGAQQVLTLPAEQADLVQLLSEAGDSAGGPAAGRGGAAITVIGGRGGAGASVFATALAQVSAARADSDTDSALLVDLDSWGGGIDLLSGGQSAAGLRWPDLDLRGGRLNWAELRDALPGYRGVRVLSAARHGHDIPAEPVAAIMEAGRRGGATVICDVPRRMTDEVIAAVESADLVVVISAADVRSCAAATALSPMLAAINPNIGLVVRGPSPGGLRARDVAEIVALPLLAAMRPEPMLAERLDRGGLRLRSRSPLSAGARRVLTALARGQAGIRERAA